MRRLVKYLTCLLHIAAHCTRAAMHLHFRRANPFLAYIEPSFCENDAGSWIFNYKTKFFIEAARGSSSHMRRMRVRARVRVRVRGVLCVRVCVCTRNIDSTYVRDDSGLHLTTMEVPSLLKLNYKEYAATWIFRQCLLLFADVGP